MTEQLIVTGKLSLSPIKVNPDYLEKWNCRMSDFVCLTVNEKLICDTLFRVGGLGTSNIEGKKYFMLIKYSEAFYADSITKIKANKPHLKGNWCILDANGTIKFEASNQLQNPYIINNSCLYSVGRGYFNIETGYFYCSPSSTCESDKFLFLENRYDKDKSRLGVFKINKEDGSFEIL